MDSKVWTVAEAKARLSEALRRASEVGPQRIGTRTSYVLVPEALWLAVSERRPSLGRWLVDNVPRGTELPPVDRRDPPRSLPFE